MTLTQFLKTGLVAVLAFTAFATIAEAGPPDCDAKPNHPKCQTGGEDPEDPPQSVVDAFWMHPDVVAAHAYWKGVGTRITVIDDFSSSNLISGRLQDDGKLGVITDRTHGQWTSLMAYLVAPGAAERNVDWNADAPLTWSSSEFDAVNLSYGLIARNRFASSYDNWDNLGDPHKSVLDAVNGDLALAVQAAGNDGNDVAVGDSVKGQVDVFSQQFVRIIKGEGDLAGDTFAGDGSFTYMSPIIFAGALQWNPDGVEGDAIDGVLGQESIASYSTVAGLDPDIQNHFLVVGVEGGRTSTDEFANYGSECGSVDNGTCLYGTSFAAPIVTGYAAIVADKFDNPAPSLVAHQLLSTATEDTIIGYSPEIHGQGEADLSLALSPVSISY